jgi:uncharacterized protein YndB with AHSA1/START domain
MSERQKGTRTQQHEIVIDAPAEAVWHAISDAEGLTRWFVEAATVEPRVGGKMWISWGDGAEGSGTIDAWEPNRRLVRILDPFDMGAAKHDPDVPQVEEFTIEQRGGKTVLRFVHSGIPNAKEWDGFYDGTNAGWQSFFRTMRHYLEHHVGKPRAVVKVVGKLPGSREEAWSRLIGPSGFGVEPVAGQAFTARVGGDVMHGGVVFANAPEWLELSIRELGDAYLAHSMAGGKAGSFVYSVLSLYGHSAPDVEAIRAKWQPWLSGVLGIESPAGVG